VKLVIQIPCYNEAETLPATLDDLPRSLPGFDEIEVLVVDDGSTDDTAATARKHGADHVVRLPRNSGLARAFSTGLDASLRLGADVVVNTDGDNQYPGSAIASLVEPILAGRAEIVIGDRQTDSIPHFSSMKKRLQSLGTRVVRLVSGTRVPDATSGFRALSRSAAAQVNVLSDYTYTLETIIQAGHKRIPMEFVPVQTNPKTRDSRLIKSDLAYVRRSSWTILRFFAIYNPLKAFTLIGMFLLMAGLVLGVRYLYFVLAGEGAGHVQSVILSAALLIIGFQVLVLALIADLVGANRRLLEEALARMRIGDRPPIEFDGTQAQQDEDSDKAAE